jgi:hypothetical protein
MFELKKAVRKKAKMRVGLFGPSGSGKTYSSLLLAYGLVQDWSKIALIDTEYGSGELYSDMGEYNTLKLVPPFSPESYIRAIDVCEKAGMEAIIIDSITHEWDGAGGCLEIHAKMTGNSFANWKEVTPRHNNFITRILSSNAHVICCGRTKTDYEIVQKEGKAVPEKIGLKTVTRDGFDYEMTIAFDIDIKHNARASKDRTSLFMDQPHFIITSDTGKTLSNWADSGADLEIEDLQTEIRNLIKSKNIPFEIVQEITGIQSSEGQSLETLQEALTKLKTA